LVDGEGDEHAIVHLDENPTVDFDWIARHAVGHRGNLISGYRRHACIR
jgi:hypothetical protein